MNIILLAYANDPGHPLSFLQDEDAEVNKILSPLISTNEWHIVREQYARTEDIIYQLELHADQIAIFAYSGHANGRQLIMEDQAANAEGVAELLGNCPNLKLVILNGCSTIGQVKRLLEVGVPVVIATSAPIEDKAATHFAISFFRNFCVYHKNIKEAFESGIKAAKVVSKTPLEINYASELSGEKSQYIWGLHYKEDMEIHLDWRLAAEIEAPETFQTNELLLQSIWEAIQPYLGINSKQAHRMRRADISDKILTELPHPISEYLRKLIAKPMPREKKEEFYNEPSLKRAQYLLYTYTTCIELLAFILLAQVWDELLKGRLIALPQPLKEAIKNLLSINTRQRKTYSLIPLIRQIRWCFEEGGVLPFIEEYPTLIEEFHQQGELHQACMYIEKVRDEVMGQRHIPEASAKALSIELEKQLSIILQRLGFLAKYQMTSTKNIHFIKYKHQLQPRYQNNFVELRFRPSGLALYSETVEQQIDHASVLLWKQDGQQSQFLNLSPFIIDQNSFDAKADLANLCVFQAHEKMARAYTFRYIYLPTANPLVVNKRKDYFEVVKEQFENFEQLVLG